MVEIAEEAIEAVKERDRLTQLKSPIGDFEETGREAPEQSGLRHRDRSPHRDM